MDLKRTELMADRTLKGSAFTDAYTLHIDEWLRSLANKVGVPDGATIVAVGGYGRREMAPNSDIDLLLVHKPNVDMAEFAREFCYPIWDSGLKLGHQVDTIGGLVELAESDLDTATALLDVRVLCGDESLGQELAESSVAQWRSNAIPNVLELHDRLTVEHEEYGEVAFTLGPDLKHGRGGLRDVQAFRWAVASGLLGGDVAVDDLTGPTEMLLRARVELHRITRTRTDRLMLDFQDDVSSALGYADGDELMIDVARAARSIVWVTSAQWFYIERSLHGRRRKTDYQRFDDDIQLDGALLSLAPDADIINDPSSILRVAEVAAKHRAFIDRDTLVRFVDELTIPVPWSAEIRQLFVELLLNGHAAIPIIEALDQVGLMTMLIPEWEPCRSKPQRNEYHRFTVDRHLLESAAEAAGLRDRVARPDLLVIGSLLHDIGKGYPGDHTEVGIELIDTIARRMGFDADDTALLVDMCRHHLLLPDVATRRDLDDDGTIKSVADTVASEELLYLLAALTEADSIATGPAAWNGARAELVYTLVDRVQHVLDGGEAAEVVSRSPAPEQLAMMNAGKFLARIVDDNITVVQPDRLGAFSRVAGVLTLNGLDILTATAHVDHGTALCEFRVRKGSEIDTLRLEAQMEAGVIGRLALEARVDERRGTYSRSKKRLSAQPIIPSVSFDNTASDQATVIEVTGPDEIGLLYRISRSFVEVGIMVTTARIQTIGDVVVDTFYAVHGGQKIVDDAHLAEIERAILHAIAKS